MKRRIVVTGLGLITPVGNDVESTWEAIKAGKSGIGQVTHIDTTHLRVHIAGEVKNFDPSHCLNHKEIRNYAMFEQYGLAACYEAMMDSGLEVTEEMSHRYGMAIGSGIGGLPYMERVYKKVVLAGDAGFRKISPFYIPSSIINMVPGFASIKYNFKGPNFAMVSACTTGVHNIGYAARTIDYGDADVMLCGGTEMATCDTGLGGFAAMRALSTRNDEPTKASRPWDKDRDGFVLSEGAGIMLLEELEHAKARGAKIYAEIAGFGMSADASHMTLPDQSGAGFSAAMNNALKDGNINPEQVDYINAHGTSTPAGDMIEATAIKTVFGDHAYNLAVSSTKSMTGHLLGAAGATEAIYCIKAMQDQIAPPTINLDNPEEGADLNFVAHKAQERKIDIVLNNSFGFGGTNGAIVFKKFVD